jgi:NADPH:quinone reductase-like Zn-dependent oxidoreductase
VINIVRRDAQAEILRGLGAKHILNSESPDFDFQLRDLCRQLNARLAFDAVAGAMTARLLTAMPPEARVVVYGGLAGELISINPGDLIFNQRRIEGFYLARWIAHQNPLALLSMQRKLYHMGDLTHATIQVRAPLQDVHRAIATYEADMSAGKVLLMPDLSPA